MLWVRQFSRFINLDVIDESVYFFAWRFTVDNQNHNKLKIWFSSSTVQLNF